MANSVIINKGPGGLGRPLPGEDFISGYLHYTTALPSGFGTSSTSARVKEIFSISDAESLGITNTHIGEVTATSSFTISATGSAGNTIGVFVGSTNLATYTVQSTDTTIGSISYNLASAINSGSSGFKSTGATTSSGVQVIVAPVGTGLGANSYSIVTTTTGGVAATYSVTFSGGVASQIDIIHYHISEYFRAQPKGDLYVGIYPNSSDFAEITTMQNYSLGKIRQIGIYKQATFATSQTALIQTQLDLCYDNYKPLEGIYQPDFSTITDLTTLPDLHTLTSENVSVCLGQDGANIGNQLYFATGKSIGCVGIMLGAVSSAPVNESIAWIAKYNMASDELDTLAFANGTLYTNLSDGAIINLDGKGYVFLEKQIGINGSYFDNPYTCISLSSDYSFVYLNRTINKASRNLRSFLLPTMASTLRLNPDGTLSEDVVGYYESLCARSLDVMVSAGELSSYGVIINPVQNVLATQELRITVELLPTGTANNIVVDLGFTTAI